MTRSSGSTASETPAAPATLTPAEKNTLFDDFDRYLARPGPQP